MIFSYYIAMTELNSTAVGTFNIRYRVGNPPIILPFAEVIYKWGKSDFEFRNCTSKWFESNKVDRYEYLLKIMVYQGRVGMR